MLRYIGLCMALGLLLHCSRPQLDPMGTQWLKGEKPYTTFIPDSISADLYITSFVGTQKNSSSAVLSAKPFQIYKVDFFPFPGFLAGSFFWEKSVWSMALYTEDKFLSDSGDSLFMPGKKGEGIPLNFVLEPLWNGLWPTSQDTVVAEGLGLLKINGAHETRSLQINPKDGTIQKVWSWKCFYQIMP
jgi:hypothetical protein